jgi:hypothetical protein
MSSSDRSRSARRGFQILTARIRKWRPDDKQSQRSPVVTRATAYRMLAHARRSSEPQSNHGETQWMEDRRDLFTPGRNLTRPCGVH